MELTKLTQQEFDRFRNFIYGKNVQGLILFVVALLSGYVLSRAWKQMQGLF